MGIECGQGGLRIDRGPLQRCVFWDLGEEVVVVVGGGDTSGLLMLSPLPHRWEVLLNVSGHVGALRKAVDTEVNGERQVL